MTTIRVTQNLSETLGEGDPSVRVTQNLTEALGEGDPSVRVTQNLIEVLGSRQRDGAKGLLLLGVGG